MATTVFSDWKATRSTGHIAESILPGRVFQFRLSSYIWAYVSDEGAGNAALLLGALGGIVMPVSGLGGKTITQDFVFQVVRGADAQGKHGEVVFEAHVVCKIFLVALVQDAGFGTVLALYSWNIVDSQSSATVTVPPTPPTTLGTAQIDASPASGAGQTNAVIEIIFDIVTPAWNFALQPGDVIRVPFAAAGPPYVVKSAAVAVRTILGGTVLHALRDPRIGQNWFLYKDGQEVRVAATKRLDEKDYGANRTLVTKKQVFYGRLHRSGAMIMALLGGPRVLLMTPYNDAVKETKWKEIMDIEVGVNILASVSTPDGAIIYAYGVAAADEIDTSKPEDQLLHQGDPTFLIFKRGDKDKWALAGRGPSKVDAKEQMPARDIAAMEWIDGTLRLTAAEGEAFRIWISENEGRNWSKP